MRNAPGRSVSPSAVPSVRQNPRQGVCATAPICAPGDPARKALRRQGKTTLATTGCVGVLCCRRIHAAGARPTRLERGVGSLAQALRLKLPRSKNHALLKHSPKGGLALALDAASIVPGGADVADVARAGAGTASIVVSVATKDRPGQALGVTGAVLTGAGAFTEWQGATAAKNIAEAIPIVGGVVGIGAVLYDGKGILKDYNDCVDH